jgi:hypothetical protein
MKAEPCFDVYDDDVTPPIYHLMFMLTRGTGNDLTHSISIDDIDPAKVTAEQRAFFEERIFSLGTTFGGGDHAAVTKFIEARKGVKPTVEEAIEEYKQFLRKHHFNPQTSIVKVSVWW